MSEICDENSSNFPKQVISATICDIREIIFGRKSKPVFIITVQRGENTSYEITKEYKDFFELQCSILDTFTVESGKNGYERIIPYLPGKIPLLYLVFMGKCSCIKSVSWYTVTHKNRMCSPLVF